MMKKSIFLPLSNQYHKIFFATKSFRDLLSQKKKKKAHTSNKRSVCKIVKWFHFTSEKFFP